MYKEYRTRQSKEAKCNIYREKIPDKVLLRPGFNKVHFAMHVCTI
ncbi:MAG: hypothetical protein H6Q13_2200 [Bacteroidetes bacterium]|jgi:hypothetical protein|nr:hypothetical protein [Bacteroidota bacterium]